MNHADGQTGPYYAVYSETLRKMSQTQHFDMQMYKQMTWVCLSGDVNLLHSDSLIHNVVGPVIYSPMRLCLSDDVPEAVWMQVEM